MILVLVRQYKVQYYLKNRIAVLKLNFYGKEEMLFGSFEDKADEAIILFLNESKNGYYLIYSCKF